MKRLLYSFLILILTALLSDYTALGEAPQDYYRKLINDWGLDINNVVASIVPGTGETTLVNTADTTYTTVLVLTSQLSNVSDNFFDNFSYRRIVIICDSTYSYKDKFTCSKSEVTSESLELTSLTDYSKDPNIIILNSHIDSKNFIVVPQLYFVAPTYLDVIREYFLTLASSYEVFDSYVHSDKSASLLAEFTHVVVGSFIYFLVISLAVSLLWPIAKHMGKNPSNLLHRNTYDFVYKNINGGLIKMRLLYIHSFVGFLGISMVVFTLISKGNKDATSIEYIVDYLTARILFQDIVTYAGDGTANISSMLLLASASIFAVFVSLALLMTPTWITFVDATTKRYILTKRLDMKVATCLCAIGLVALCYFAATLKLSAVLPYILFILIGLGYINYQVNLHKMHLNELFTKSQKSLILVLCFSILVYQLIKFDNPIYTFPIQHAKVVTLPIHLNQKGLYQKLVISPSFPVMANNYLIYYPGYAVLKNTSVKTFSGAQDFALLLKDPGDLLREIVRNDTLRTWVEQALPENYSPLFFTSEVDHKYEKLYIDISYKCFSSHDAKKYTLDIYSNEKADIYKNSSALDVFYFPGCVAGDTNSFRLPLGLDYLPNGVLAFDFHASSYDTPVDELNIKLFKDGKQLKTHGIPQVSHRRILLSNIADPPRSHSLDFYTFDALNEMTFESTSAETVDIASAINKLLLSKSIPQEFDLWTIYDGMLLKTDYTK